MLNNNTACDWLAWNEFGAYYNTKILEFVDPWSSKELIDSPRIDYCIIL
jgi:hypothetical protein